MALTRDWFEAAFGSHYPLLYEHRDDAEAGRCLAQLQGMAPFADRSEDRILDLGCGDGRHLELLFRLGYAAVGLDLSPQLLARARDRRLQGDAFPLVRGDMRRLPFAGNVFASVMSLFTAFGYFESPAANRVPVAEVARTLQPGGHWFLDYFDGDKVRAELGSGGTRARDRDLGPLRISELRRFDAGRSLVTKDVLLRPLPGQLEEAAGLGVPPEGMEYTEQVAVFTLAELDDMAGSQGLSRVAAAGGYEGQELGGGTRWILVYRKQARDDAS